MDLSQRYTNVCCVETEDYGGCGLEYVRRLTTDIDRYMSYGVHYRIWCFTDRDKVPEEEWSKKINWRGIDPAWGLRGWWNKLFMFQRENFPLGEPCLFFDLDTHIVGQLDDFCNAALAPPYFAMMGDQWGRMEHLHTSGIMAWVHHEHSIGLWEKWHREGRPIPLEGDQKWISFCMRRDYGPPAVMQKLCPGQIATPRRLPYMGDTEVTLQQTRAIFYHGQPKPHALNWEIPTKLYGPGPDPFKLAPKSNT